MIKSMTGFASLTHEDERATIGVTVRAVNHRFLDVQLRMPQSLADLEPRMRALLQKRLARGRVELGITLQGRQVMVPTVELNEEFVNALTAAMDRAREQVAAFITDGYRDIPIILFCLSHGGVANALHICLRQNRRLNHFFSLLADNPFHDT